MNTIGAMNELGPYKKVLDRWLTGALLVKDPMPRGPDAIIGWGRGRNAVTFVAECKRHVATQDIRLVATQLERWLATAKGRNRRALLLAPYVRHEQAKELRAKGINYLDLLGNAHLEAPGVFVHVEGRRPDKDERPPQGRLTKGWVKTVMALLLRPELINGPYRPIAEAANVALGTITACTKDLTARGLLQETKHDRKIVNVPDLVALWVQTYGEVLRPRLRVRYFQMREAKMRTRWTQLNDELTRRAVPWALTGADGAAVHKDFFQAAETEIYADPRQLEDRDILKALVAQPAVRQGNLRVIEPPGPLALAQKGKGGPPTAPLLLIYAELRLRGTEQANEAAEMLLPELLADAQP
jgi:hypothetical protein